MYLIEEADRLLDPEQLRRAPAYQEPTRYRDLAAMLRRHADAAEPQLAARLSERADRLEAAARPPESWLGASAKA